MTLLTAQEQHDLRISRIAAVSRVAIAVNGYYGREVLNGRDQQLGPVLVAAANALLSARNTLITSPKLLPRAIGFIDGVAFTIRTVAPASARVTKLDRALTMVTDILGSESRVFIEAQEENIAEIESFCAAA